ncbi:MAG: hypothetical protein KGM16_07025 [Bacteroidota bacterium]|nr:hypothetical protein [Bacteroidota bacterium]
MIKWLSKILFVVVSISFFISATEMDFGNAHNTFFDQYDTYVNAEHVSFEQETSLQPEHDAYVFINYLINQYHALQSLSQTSKFSHLAYYNQYPPKLFLRNSVFRI